MKTEKMKTEHEIRAKLMVLKYEQINRMHSYSSLEGMIRMGEWVLGIKRN